MPIIPYIIWKEVTYRCTNTTDSYSVHGSCSRHLVGQVS